MKPFRFVHAADLHLDSPFKGLSALPASVRDRIRESSFEALQRLVRLAVEQRVDFVLISGDVYDLADRSLRAQLRFQQAARTLSEHGIALYVIHGNHDPLHGDRASLDWPDAVYFFGGETVETIMVRDREGDVIASISGISYVQAATTAPLASRFPRPRQDIYAIAMLHTNVDGAAGHDNYAPSSLKELVQSGYSYWALGHIHTRQVLHEEPYVVYPGNTQGRSVKECGPRGCYVVDVDEEGHSTLVFHELSAVRWERQDISIEGLEDEQQLKYAFDRILAELAASCVNMPVVVRISLTGRGPLHRLLQTGTLLQELVDELRAEQTEVAGAAGSFVWIESVKLHTGPEISLSSLRDQDSFVGDLLKLTDKLLADEEALQAFYSDAAASLVQNPKVAKWLRELAPDTDALLELLDRATMLAVHELMDEEGWSS